MLLNSLNRRDRQPELMDQPHLDPARHRRALRGLARINRFSGSDRILWPSLLQAARQASRTLRVLDVATGAGDVPIRLWQRFQRSGLSIELTGCDFSPTALELARESAQRRRASIEFLQRDVLEQGIPDGFDIIICSLFLHHLDENQAFALLRSMREAAPERILINDLSRSRFGYWLAVVGSRLLSRSDVVHVDAPLSVRAAFTPVEALRLAERAGMTGATVARRWPCRYLLSWSRE